MHSTRSSERSRDIAARRAFVLQSSDMALTKVNLVSTSAAASMICACSVTTDLSSLGARDGGVDAPPLGCNAQNADVIAYWPMEEGQGTTVADCSGNGLTATIVGAATWVTGRRPDTKAIQFDSTTNTYVLVSPSARADATTTFTLAAWVNLGTGVNSYIIDKGQPPSLSWSLEMETDTSLSFYTSADGTAAVDANRVNGPVSTWFHIAAVFQPGTTQTIYINGISAVSAAAPASMHQGTDQLMIGWRTKGMIDEIRFYSRALTATEIAALAAE